MNIKLAINLNIAIKIRAIAIFEISFIATPIIGAMADTIAVKVLYIAMYMVLFSDGVTSRSILNSIKFVPATDIPMIILYSTNINIFVDST
jgi:hypothetical protein